jgi:hypothetical protein
MIRTHFPKCYASSGATFIACLARKSNIQLWIWREGTIACEQALRKQRAIIAANVEITIFDI